MRRPRQLTFDDHRRRTHGGRGGYRKGAGRPARRPGIVHHVRRPGVPAGCPAHLTLRVRAGIGSLRSRAFAREFKTSLAAACEQGAFRVVHYSLQRDHLHLIVEAAGKQALGAGMKSISSRLARVAQRVFGWRGPVLDGRYHLRLLGTPREVRNALAYVLPNVRKHWRQRNGHAPPVRLDEASSGRWFDGWSVLARGPTLAEPREVAPARTWLLTRGWRRHGLVDPAEVPGGRTATPRS
jgi:REP element-mobilizing transposase RayT